MKAFRPGNSRSGNTSVRDASLRLRAARFASALLPPVGAHLITSRLYPWHVAAAHALELSRRSITGSVVHVNTADEYGYHFSTRGYYEWRALAVARVLCRPGDTIVEVGANIGTETAGLADIVGPEGCVHAFEPVPANLVRLRLNAPANVTIHPLAVSDRTGALSFTLPDARNSGIGRISDDGNLTVESTTLDVYLQNTPARLLMMDVEGAEVDVLNGGADWLALHRPAIIAEAHHRKHELLEKFYSLGYAVHSIERWGLRPPRPDAPQWNWLALHRTDPISAGAVTRSILVCGLLPGIINPLSRSQF